MLHVNFCCAVVRVFRHAVGRGNTCGGGRLIFGPLSRLPEGGD